MTTDVRAFVCVSRSNATSTPAKTEQIRGRRRPADFFGSVYRVRGTSPVHHQPTETSTGTTPPGNVKESVERGPSGGKCVLPMYVQEGTIGSTTHARALACLEMWSAMRYGSSLLPFAGKMKGDRWERGCEVALSRRCVGQCCRAWVLHM